MCDFTIGKDELEFAVGDPLRRSYTFATDFVF